MALGNIVVTGASLAGLNAVEELRARGYDGRLTWISMENHLPYDRPPLSKEILLGRWSVERARLRDETHFDTLGVDLRFGTSAEYLDLASRTLRIDGGEWLRFDGMIIATGAHPKRLTNHNNLTGVHVLRSMEDCLALRAAFETKPRVVIIGFGFIGGEVASAARQCGLAVTVVDSMSYPFSRVLGPKAGMRCANLHADCGVQLCFNVEIAGLTGRGHVEAVHLTDGTTIPADLVVVGIGAEPSTEWLASSGIGIADGVVCDRFCSAAPGIYAAGDVARWMHARLNRSIRIEHWANAQEQGRAAARNLLSGTGGSQEFAPDPYFWSYQYCRRLQFFGFPGNIDNEWLIEVAEDRFAALYETAGNLCGAAIFNWPQMSILCRRMVGEGVKWDSALAAANNSIG